MDRENRAIRGEADWDALKTEYITGGMSYRVLAQKHSLSASQVEKVASRNGWPAARKRWREDNAAQAARACGKKRVAEMVRLMNSVSAMTSRVERVMGDEDQFYRHLVSEPQYDRAGHWTGNRTEEKTFEKADTKAISDMAKAMRELTATVRNLWGVPTQAEAEAQEIARRRLELDEEKAGREAQSGNAVIRIVMDPAAQELAE